MTIVTALRAGGVTWLGYNDGATIGDTVLAGCLHPWLFFGDWALGISGQSSQQSLLNAEIGRLTELDGDEEKVALLVREILTDQGNFAFDDDAGVREFNIWSILAHINGDIFDLDSRLSLTPIPEGKLWARGSGTDFALGADFVLADLQLSPEERIRKATEAAIAGDVYCAGNAKTVQFG